MSKYIYSILLYLGLLSGHTSAWAKGQNLFTGMQLSMDIWRPLRYSCHERKGTHYEFSAAMDISQWMFEGDYGWGNIQWEGENQETRIASSYTSDGHYFRIGFNYNMLQDTPDSNAAFVGLRYARSLFKDHLVSKVCYNSEGLVENTSTHIPIDSCQKDVRAYWLEAVTGVRVRIWKLLYTGGTLRYKFHLRFEGAESHLPYDVLGWDDSPFGFSLYLSLRIPFVRS
mmetsp:Transcript_6344/g.14341  ORF Transcript_6344/g.14341 Transcript_6344/m.14341 type:complete len:227 (+) Transcript_6344:866-1546(+)